jgi:hypothetical protein
MRSLVSAMLLSLAIGVGTALAQTSNPGPTGQPASAPQMSQDQKKAISKPAPIRPMPKACTARNERNSGPSAKRPVASLSNKQPAAAIG